MLSISLWYGNTLKFQIKVVFVFFFYNFFTFFIYIQICPVQKILYFWFAYIFSKWFLVLWSWLMRLWDACFVEGRKNNSTDTKTCFNIQVEWVQEKGRRNYWVHRALEKFLNTQLAASAEPQKGQCIWSRKLLTDQMMNNLTFGPGWELLWISTGYSKRERTLSWSWWVEGDLQDSVWCRFVQCNCGGQQGKAVLEFNKDWQRYNDRYHLIWLRSFIKNNWILKEYYDLSTIILDVLLASISLQKGIIRFCHRSISEICKK